ncbi:DNA-binding SARP family transcriptional activator [Kribbella sp. VKM Ac-2569]|nr:DNA-binding SARP family transcriptional activator [Kribbella sp. VKM Ac-2569]
MAGLRLRLLGQFACESSGSSVDLPFGIQRLVAFLALRGPSHRCMVAGSLWPEVPDAQALASLRTGVWRMNRLAHGLLEAQGTGLRMSAHTWVDSKAQEDFAKRVVDTRLIDGREYEKDLETLYPPELLPGWYDDWVIFERQRLSQLRLHALEIIARRLTQRDELDVALRLALEAVRTEPLRETANAVLMSVYLAEGNVSDAIRQYAVFRDLLQRELGLEPSARLTRLLPAQARTTLRASVDVLTPR